MEKIAIAIVLLGMWAMYAYLYTNNKKEDHSFLGFIIFVFSVVLLGKL